MSTNDDRPLRMGDKINFFGQEAKLGFTTINAMRDSEAFEKIAQGDAELESGAWFGMIEGDLKQHPIYPSYINVIELGEDNFIHYPLEILEKIQHTVHAQYQEKASTDSRKFKKLKKRVQSRPAREMTFYLMIAALIFAPFGIFAYYIPLISIKVILILIGLLIAGTEYFFRYGISRKTLNEQTKVLFEGKEANTDTDGTGDAHKTDQQVELEKEAHYGGASASKDYKPLFPLKSHNFIDRMSYNDIMGTAEVLKWLNEGHFRYACFNPISNILCIEKEDRSGPRIKYTSVCADLMFFERVYYDGNDYIFDLLNERYYAPVKDSEYLRKRIKRADLLHIPEKDT